MTHSMASDRRMAILMFATLSHRPASSFIAISMQRARAIDRAVTTIFPQWKPPGFIHIHTRAFPSHAHLAPTLIKNSAPLHGNLPIERRGSEKRVADLVFPLPSSFSLACCFLVVCFIGVLPLFFERPYSALCVRHMLFWLVQVIL